jgi:hypothetical protein
LLLLWWVQLFMEYGSMSVGDLENPIKGLMYLIILLLVQLPKVEVIGNGS